MAELRPIELKHKKADAAMIRRVVSRLEKQRVSDDELLMVLIYLSDVARRIDDAFRRPKVVALRPGQPEPPKPAA